MRHRRRRSITQDSTTTPGSQLLALSLFIMLLAFFIVLNAISTFEEDKLQDVMLSIEDTFSARITEASNEKPSTAQSDQKSLNEGDTIEQIDALFKAQIPGYEVVKNRQRGMMLVQVPRKEFEDAVKGLGDKKASSGFSTAFLPTLVSLMRSEGRGTPYRVDVTYYLEDNPARLQNQQPQRMAETIRNVGGVARQIEGAGLQARLMTIGLQKGNPEMVDLVFQRHRPFNPMPEGAHADDMPVEEGGGDAEEASP